jgi:hypothetical protein
MERLGSLVKKLSLIVAAAMAIVIASPRIASAQDAPPADPLKFSTASPVIIGWTMKADKAADFEAFWVKVKEWIARTDDAGLKAFAETLNKIYKVDSPPVEVAGSQAVIYVMHLDPASTTHSYNPQTILYTYLGAGVQGSKLTREEADPVYTKLTQAFLGVNPIWKLVKVGG